MKLCESRLYRADIQKALTKTDLSFLVNKRVLITGGTGLIGSTIVDLIIANNLHNSANTIVYLASRNKMALNRFGDAKCVKWMYYDALEPLEINEDVDYIIHAAGNASPELYVSQAVETMVMNICGLNNLLCYSKLKNVEGILFLSSSEVYGIKTSSLPFVEDEYGSLDHLRVRSSYASSKRAAETLCVSFSSEYGVRTLIARPGHVFGPSASINDKRVSSLFSYEAAKGNDLVMKSTGFQIRSYIYSIDCARALITILKNGQSGEAYNVCGKECISIREMASIIADAGNVKLRQILPTDAEKKQFNPMDNASLNGEKLASIGFEQCFSLKEALLHTVQIIKEVYTQEI